MKIKTKKRQYITPLKIYNGMPSSKAEGRLHGDLRETLPINELKGKPHMEVCPILNLHGCNNRKHNGTVRRRKLKGAGNCTSLSCAQDITTTKKVKKIKTVEEKAGTKIALRLKKNYLNKKKEFFNSICTTSGVCIIFGDHSEMINKYFSNFTNTDYVVQPIKLITTGDNGFISEIQYRRGFYTAYAILKSSYGIEHVPDNLGYEYIVGKYINKIMKKYTCFLETYGIFKYKNIKHDNGRYKENSIYKQLLSNSRTHLDLSKDLELLDETDTDSFYKTSCTNNSDICVLIQHISRSTTLGNFLRYKPNGTDNTRSLNRFINTDIIGILYQIYMPLSRLIDNFTHYDLHLNNILLTQPIKDGYVDFYYHLEDGSTVNFKSRYIAKIIDYGRCYFKENDENNSLVVYNKICALKKECGGAKHWKDCGRGKGYGFLNSEKSDGGSFYIISHKVNKSHDLRALQLLNEQLNEIYTKKNKVREELPAIPYYLTNLLSRVHYETYYGTPVKESEPLHLPLPINNVFDAFKEITTIITSEGVSANNKEWYEKNFNKIGELHTYCDGRNVEFIKANTDEPEEALPEEQIQPGQEEVQPGEQVQREDEAAISSGRTRTGSKRR